MTSLEHPDNLHLRAATGWLELGNPSEASHELDKITPSQQNQPAVLKVRWHVCHKVADWDAAKQVSRTLITVAPNEADSWRLRANSFYYEGDYRTAHEIASSKISQFKDDWKLHYDLACYCSCLARLDEARKYLGLALDLGDGEEIKMIAVDDADLKPLWGEILKM